MFDFLFILPRVFTLGQDIMRCLDGDITDEEYQRVLDSLTALVNAIPALQGFVAIIQSLLKVARVAFPIIEALQDEFLTPVTGPVSVTSSTAKLAKLKALAAADQLSPKDLKHAKASARLLTDVSAKIAEKKNIAPVTPVREPFDVSAVFGID